MPAGGTPQIYRKPNLNGERFSTNKYSQTKTKNTPLVEDVSSYLFTNSNQLFFSNLSSGNNEAI